MLPSDCPFCHHKNPAGAKFCNECGSPLNLAPCKRCGAINNMMDAECQRCGAILVRPGSSAEPAQAEAEFARSGGEPSTLDQDLALIEQGLRELGEAPASPTLPDGAAVVHVKQGAPELAKVPEGSALPDNATVVRGEQSPRELAQLRVDSAFPESAAVAQVEQTSEKSGRNRGAESPFAGPGKPPLGRRVDARWQELLAIAMFVVAIAGGGYFSYRLAALPVRETLMPWLGWLRLDAPAEPRAASDAPPVVAPDGPTAKPSPPPAVAAQAAPRAASDAPSAVAPGEVAATGPAPRAIVAPQEPGIARDVPAAPAAGPAPTGAPQPACPPAVAAMSLCDANRP